MPNAIFRTLAGLGASEKEVQKPIGEKTLLRIEYLTQGLQKKDDWSTVFCEVIPTLPEANIKLKAAYTGRINEWRVFDKGKGVRGKTIKVKNIKQD